MRGEEPASPSPKVPREDAQRTDVDTLLGALTFTASGEPILVTADTMEFDYRTRVLSYKGVVEVSQGDMKLKSESLTVVLDEGAANQVREIVAEGSVRLSKGSRWATGGRAVFNQQARTVELSSEAVVHDGPNIIRGDRVVVYLDEERSVVEGGNNRVQTRIFPSTVAKSGTQEATP